MRNAFQVTSVILLIILTSCSREDNNGFLWEKSHGEGSAFASFYTNDSLFIFAGSLSGYPAALKTTLSGRLIYQFDGEHPGAFTSLTEDTSGITLAGSSEGRLMVTRLSDRFHYLWSRTYDFSTEIETARIARWDDDSFVVVAGDWIDSLRYNSFLILLLDGDGEIISMAEPSRGYTITVNDMVKTGNNDLITALTRKEGGDKSQAVIARFDISGNLIWERELYNNPEFGASVISLTKGTDEIVYATGSTEITEGESLFTSSWVAAFTAAGDLLWKRYLENSNSGEDIMINKTDQLMVMNRNCGIINYLSLPDGTIVERFRMYDACDPSEHMIELSSMNILPGGEYLVTGRRSGKFYYARHRGPE
ncbi:MAG: hypothetical protein LC649_10345 [Bacteroidales bacterium]|nr:hypothetical protein [Bacteroidales bacterium]